MSDLPLHARIADEQIARLQSQLTEAKATIAKQQALMKRTKTALERCRDGFEYTRQYVGYEMLPPIEGWSWYDGDCAAKEAIDDMAKHLEEKDD